LAAIVSSLQLIVNEKVLLNARLRAMAQASIDETRCPPADKFSQRGIEPETSKGILVGM
jgi:hypothetical protein